MYLASLRVLPSTCVLPILSDPAKSTRCNLDTNPTSFTSELPSNVIVNMQCDLDEH